MDEIEPIEVEVRVHRGRRRRPDRPPPDTPRPPNVRNWLIYAGLTGLVAALMFDGYLNHKPRDRALPKQSEATDVTSTISLAADSLQVVVSWDLTLSTPEGQPDSIRIKVVPAPGNDSIMAMRPATVFADTAYVPAPVPGQTLTGSSCVEALHPVEPLTEVCTPCNTFAPVPRLKRAWHWPEGSSFSQAGSRWTRMSGEGAPSGNGPIPVSRSGSL